MQESTEMGAYYSSCPLLSFSLQRPSCIFITAIAIRPHILTHPSGGRLALALHSLNKPIITALNGSAVGVGITMTLPTNIRIAYFKAKIGFVFARRGIVMEGCSSFYLPRLLGYSRAMHLVTTGSTYEANHEMVRGLFSELVEDREEVLPRALAVAEEVVRNTSAVSYTHLTLPTKRIV